MKHARDNARSRDRGPTLLMALRAGRPEHSPEAEPVLAYVQGATVRLELDDGEILEFDAAELRAAIAGATALMEAA